MKLIVKIEGDDWSDLELALGEVKQCVEAGYTSGADRNDTGTYSFEVKELG